MRMVIQVSALKMLEIVVSLMPNQLEFLTERNISTISTVSSLEFTIQKNQRSNLKLSWKT